MSRSNNQNTSVAVLQQPRMQMPAHVAADYGLNDDSWRALTDAVFPMAKTVGAVVLALAYCQRHRLDVFQRVVHIVPMKVGGREMESVWPGIGQLRIMAQRQPDYDGYDDCDFGPDVEEEFDGFKTKFAQDAAGNWKPQGSERITKKIRYPEWAQFVVYKTINGERRRLPGPRVYWRETYATMGRDNPCPNEMWEKRPRGQLEKCAEAAAWRRAFPDVLGNEYVMEEMVGRDLAEGAIEGQFVEVKEESPHTRAAPKEKPRQTAKPADQVVKEGDGGPNPLDGDSIPPDDAWEDYLGLLVERLATFEYVSEVLELRTAEKFRTDCAPPAIQVRAGELFDTRETELEAAGDDTANGAMDGEPAGQSAEDNTQGGDDEKAGR